MTGKEIRLASRPKGRPTVENFAIATVDLPPLAEGQVLVRNLFMSVDPYMRGRMNDAKSYVAPFQVGQVLDGGAIGEVVESRDPALAAGTIVHSMRGWRDSFVAGAKEVRAVDASVTPRSAHLGVLGMPGLTAWVGLRIVDTKPDDRVFVSGAAGAVGGIAGQLAKLRGCFVVGSAGSAEKARMLTKDFGFDSAINYRSLESPQRGGSLAVALRRALADAAPDGFDVYFDNVGGDHLEAAIANMRDHGRIAACGSVSRYNDETPAAGPRNMSLIVSKRLTIRGFIVTDWRAETKTFLAEVAPLVADGRIKVRETVVEGLANAPQAFIDMLDGVNVGKMIVKI